MSRCYECEHSTWCPAHDGEPAAPKREPHIIFEATDLFYDYYICEGCPLCEEDTK